MSINPNLAIKNKKFNPKIISQLKTKKNLKFKKVFYKAKKKIIKSFIFYIQGIIHVKSTSNNTIITLTDLLGNTIAWVSCGSIGFKGSKRSSRFAAQAVAEQLGVKAKTLGYNKIILHLNGLGKGRNVCIKGFKNSGLQIHFIQDSTSIAYNGCRPSKIRRI